MDNDIMIRSNSIDIDINRYDCELMSHLEIESDPDVIKYRPAKGVQTLFVEARDNPQVLQLEFLFHGTVSKIKENVAKLRQLLINCEVSLGCEADKVYCCIYKSQSHEYIALDLASYKFEFEYEKFSRRRTISEIKDGSIFFIDGVKETPINFEIYALENVANLNINGFLVKELPKGVILHINSEKGLLIANDMLYSKYIEFVDFPYALGRYEIQCNSEKVKITVSYRERW